MIGEWLFGSDNESTPFDSNTIFRVSAPFNDFAGVASWREFVAEPLLGAIDGADWSTAMELRSAPIDGSWQAASWGTLTGVFMNSWCGLHPSGSEVSVRIGAVVDLVGDAAIRCTVMIDVLDLAEQAGQDLTRRSLGKTGLWPLPRAIESDDDGASDESATTLSVVKQMQSALHDSARTRDEMIAAAHLAYWHADFVWAGPGGIGSSTGAEGFVDFHQLSFRTAFPDRVGGGLLESADETNTTGHFVKFAEGRWAVTGGWPSVTATHSADGWLGESASGRRITLRVFDFYQVDEGKISMNWVFIDLLDFLAQIDRLPRQITHQGILTRGR